MKLNDMSYNELEMMIIALQELIDGNFWNASEVSELTGLDCPLAEKVLEQINVLKTIETV